ncbi:TPA: type II/IV secretion system ATPase subunit [Thermoplasmata archaeon]|nr:type II/IV secretion system ATPase subunit [Thermoplasmata archaeon]
MPADKAGLTKAIRKNPHLAEYVQDFIRVHRSRPEYITDIPRDMGDQELINIIYSVGDPLFVHIFSTKSIPISYTSVQPPMTKELQPRFDRIIQQVYNKAVYKTPHETVEEFKEALLRLIEASTSVVEEADDSVHKKSLFGDLFTEPRVQVTERELELVKYHATQNIVLSGPLQPLLRDPYIEDIHCIGPDNVSIVHKVFQAMPTNIKFESLLELDNYVRALSERIGRPASMARPVVDGTLEDGSRINLVYADDVSVRGPSFSIRKFAEEPISITQLISWNTISSKEAAYIWLCLEEGMSVFFCGETASGKTTTMGAVLPFIKYDSKVYTAEDTVEMRVPQSVWQRLATRDFGPEESRVDTFALLKAALRSRPNYIIVGEIRGKEGSVAFQAMQTGHPVLSTFHAASTRKLIQRFTSDPINVPITFIDNLNVAFFQAGIYRGGKFLRRSMFIDEIVGFNEALGGIMTRTVFLWNAADDSHVFKGMNNSYILEEKIAVKRGYGDKRKIYDDLDLRTRILDEMISMKLFRYDKVESVITEFQKKGVSGLPFSV